MTVGDVCWVEFPARGGHAQAGRRPAIILQQSIASLSTTLLVPLTSQLDALRFFGTVLLESDAQNGLRQHSVALVFQLTAVDNRFIKNKLGSISGRVLEQIYLTLDSLTGRI
jgi:mRNA-degrading endonuclease toxin of MazEF toxin-antitoxin module